MDRLLDRSHPNKVSMKRKKKKPPKAGDERLLYPSVEPSVDASGKRGCIS